MMLPFSPRLHLRVSPLELAVKFVERAEIGFGRGHDNIRICAVAIDDAAGFLQSYRHLPLRIGTARYGINGE